MGDIGISSSQNVSNAKPVFEPEKVKCEAFDQIVMNNTSVFGNKAAQENLIDNYCRAADDAESAYCEADTDYDGKISVNECKKIYYMDISRYMNRDENGEIIDTSFKDMLLNAYNVVVNKTYTVDYFGNDEKVVKRCRYEKGKMKEFTEYENGQLKQSSEFSYYPKAYVITTKDANGKLLYERTFNNKTDEVMSYTEYDSEGNVDYKKSNFLGDKKE